MSAPYFSRAFLDACDEKDLAILRLELAKHPGDHAHLAEVEAEEITDNEEDPDA